MRFLKIGENDDQQRLDRYLGKILPNAPRSMLHKMIRTKKIKVNRKTARAEQVLSQGDEVEIYLYEEVLHPFEKKHIAKSSRLSLSYVYEDENIALIDKEAGVLVHAASAKDYGNNIVDAFVDELIARGEYVPRREMSFRPSLANRLDYNTAGLVIGLKNHHASLTIHEALRSGRIKKIYRAYCFGEVAEPVTIRFRLKKQNQTMQVTNGDQGVEAITHVRPLCHTKDWSYLEVELETGRFHQIRAHLNAIGHPLIGDRRYGRHCNLPGISHQLLLSYALSFGEVGLSGLDGRTFYSRRGKELENYEKQIRAFFNR